MAAYKTAAHLVQSASDAFGQAFDPRRGLTSFLPNRKNRTVQAGSAIAAFLAQLEELGEDEVRFLLHTGVYGDGGDQKHLAQDWLQRKERDRAEISNAQEISAAARAATAAERAADAATGQSRSIVELARASAEHARIAREALAIARIAAAVSAIALIACILGLIDLFW